MSKINFRYEWFSPEKKVLRCIAEGDWNWKDYHSCMRVASFALLNSPHPVHVLLDFRESTRPQFPSGLAAHASTFGKKLVPQMSGNALVLGIPPTLLATLGLGDERVMSTKEGHVYFLLDDAEIPARLAELDKKTLN